MFSRLIFASQGLAAVCEDDLEFESRWRKLNGFDRTPSLEHQIHQNRRGKPQSGSFWISLPATA